MYTTKTIKSNIVKKIKRYIKGSELSFKDNDNVLTNGCTILKECKIEKISKKIAIVDQRIKEPTIYKHGFFGCIVMLPSIRKTSEICHITRIKPDTLIIESESIPTLISYISNKVCNINLKRIVYIDNDNSYHKLTPKLSSTGKTGVIERIAGLHLLEHKLECSEHNYESIDSKNKEDIIK